MNILNASSITPAQKLRTFLFIKKIKQIDIARGLKTSRSNVNHVFTGHVKSRARREEICKFIGVEYSDI
jgi:predicted XRE-type DNA-binding protein